MKTRIILFAFLACAFLCHSQPEEIVEDYSNSYWNNSINLYMSPLHLINNGVHLDLEYITRDKKNGIVLGLTNYLGQVKPNCDYHYSSTPSNCSEFDQLKGVGLELAHKYFVSKSLDNDYRIYIQNRLGYEQLHFDFQDYASINYFDDEFGVNAVRYELTDLESRFTRLTYQFSFGQTFAYWEVVRFDWYLGFIIKAVNINGNGKEYRLYDSFFGDYGFEGTNFSAGFRIGVAL